MKKYIILFIAILVSNSFAQFVVGGKGGINFNKATIKINDGFGDVDSKYLTSFHIGGLAEYQFTSALLAQVELLYITKGYKTENEVSGLKQETKVRTHNIEVPLLIKPVILSNDNINLYVLAGLYLDFAIAGTTSLEIDGEDNDKTTFKLGYDETDNMKRFDMGFKVGFEIQTKKTPVFFSFDFQQGFLNLAPLEGEKIHNRGFDISIGYKFGKHKKNLENIIDINSKDKIASQKRKAAPRKAR